MAWGSVGLAFLAGLLSTLSPCVLPLLPIVFGTALSKHRLGPLALALGLSVSFVAIGLFVATIGFALGLDDGVFRKVAAILMIAVGLFISVARLEAGFALAAGPVGNWTQQRFGSAEGVGLGGQFWNRPAARRSLEPLCGTNFGSSLAPGGPGPEPWPSCRDDVFVRHWGCNSAAACQFDFKNHTDALAGPSSCNRERCKEGFWNCVHCIRSVDPQRFGPGPSNNTRPAFAGMALKSLGFLLRPSIVLLQRQLPHSYFGLASCKSASGGVNFPARKSFTAFTSAWAAVFTSSCTPLSLSRSSWLSA